MAIIDTHKVFESLTDAGFSKAQANALLGAVGESHDTLATKADLQDLAQATKADLQDLAQATKADLQDLAQATKADLQAIKVELQAEIAEVRVDVQALAHAVSACATKAELREMELRMRLHLGGVAIIAASLQLAILGFLMALFTGALP